MKLIVVFDKFDVLNHDEAGPQIFVIAYPAADADFFAKPAFNRCCRRQFQIGNGAAAIANQVVKQLAVKVAPRRK